MKQLGRELRKALMTGVSYMLPFIVVAGLCIAVTGILQTYLSIESETLAHLSAFAWTVMDLIPAIFGAYCAYSIADKPGICPGFLGGYIAAHPILEGTASSGFLGGLAAGLVAGVLVQALKKLPFPAVIASLKAAVVIPLVSSVAMYLFMAYPIGIAVGRLNAAAVDGLLAISGSAHLAFLLGAILSAMCAADMGGPVGKIAITFVFAVWSDPSGLGFMVNAAVFPGIMVPPIATGLAALLAPTRFTASERASAPAALATGLVGITEAALPYALRDPVRVIGCNVAGAAVGGALMMALQIQTPGVSGIIGIPAASSPLLFSLCILTGVVIATGLLVLVKKPVPASQTVEEAALDMEISFI